MKKLVDTFRPAVRIGHNRSILSYETLRHNRDRICMAHLVDMQSAIILCLARRTNGFNPAVKLIY